MDISAILMDGVIGTVACNFVAPEIAKLVARVAPNLTGQFASLLVTFVSVGLAFWLARMITGALGVRSRLLN